MPDAYHCCQTVCVDHIWLYYHSIQSIAVPPLHSAFYCPWIIASKWLADIGFRLSDPAWCHDKESNALQLPCVTSKSNIEIHPFFPPKLTLCKVYLFFFYIYILAVIMSKQWVNTIKQSTSVLRTRLVLPPCKPKYITVRPMQTQSTSTIPSMPPPVAHATTHTPLQKPLKRVRPCCQHALWEPVFTEVCTRHSTSCWLPIEARLHAA